MRKYRLSFTLLSIFCVLKELSIVECTTSTGTRPPFLRHVAKETLLEAMRVAAIHHQTAVQVALENYPVDMVDQVADIGEKVAMKEYQLKTDGSLPDFADKLPTTVYVTDPPLLSKDECYQVIRDAEEHFETNNNGQWTMQQSGQYDVAGFYIKQIPKVHEWFLTTLKRKLFPVLSQTFPEFCESPDDLCVDNAYLFKYTPETGRRTDVHTDSGCLSFTIALNSKNEYEGGGTWFHGLQGDQPVVEMDAGQVTVRPGGVKHCGFAVTSGTRYIIGGFCMNRKKPEHVRQLLSSSSEDTKLMEAAVVLNPRNDAVYNLLANRYEANGQPDKAIEVLEYCLKNVHGFSGEVAYALGSLYMDKKEYAKANECMEICLSVDQADVDALMGVAQCAASLGDRTKEEEYFQRIINTPGAKPKILAQAYCNLGVLCNGSDKELFCFQSSLELVPDSFAARYSLGCAYAHREMWEQAVETFKITLSHVGSEDAENKSKSLNSLYTAVMHYLQARQSVDGVPSSQEEMTKRFQDVMGEKNFQAMLETRQCR